uniref:Uncharacterized protein n=1 Tax=Ditylenchus dipsaci TaxID=166011 RepID=A0A915DNV8_9BILA
MLLFFYTLELLRLCLPFADSCSHLWYTPLLFYLRSAGVVAANGVSSSFIVLCVERIVCISHIRLYENSNVLYWLHLVFSFYGYPSPSYSYYCILLVWIGPKR